MSSSDENPFAIFAATASSSSSSRTNNGKKLGSSHNGKISKVSVRSLAESKVPKLKSKRPSVGGWMSVKRKGVDDGQIARDAAKAKMERQKRLSNTTMKKGKLKTGVSNKKSGGRKRSNRSDDDDDSDDHDNFIINSSEEDNEEEEEEDFDEELLDDDEEEDDIDSPVPPASSSRRLRNNRSRPHRRQIISILDSDASSSDEGAEEKKSEDGFSRKNSKSHVKVKEMIDSSDTIEKFNKKNYARDTFDAKKSTVLEDLADAQNDNRSKGKSKIETKEKMTQLKTSPYFTNYTVDQDESDHSGDETWKSSTLQVGKKRKKIISVDSDSDATPTGFKGEKLNESDTDMSPAERRELKLAIKRSLASVERDDADVPTASFKGGTLNESDSDMDKNERVALKAAIKRSLDDIQKSSQGSSWLDNSPMVDRTASNHQRLKRLKKPNSMKASKRSGIIAIDSKDDNDDSCSSSSENGDAASVLKTANELSMRVLLRMQSFCSHLQQQSTQCSIKGRDATAIHGLIVDGALALSTLQDKDEKSDKSWLSREELSKCISSDIKLADYQLIGVNWMALMDGLECNMDDCGRQNRSRGRKSLKKRRSNVNGVLADEMGLVGTNCH